MSDDATVCALCGREPPTFEHAALRCGAMAAERAAVEDVLYRWQPRVGPEIALWLMAQPPDRRGLAALCGIVSPVPGTADLPLPERWKLACELAAVGADLALSYVQRANATGAPCFYEPRHSE